MSNHTYGRVYFHTPSSIIFTVEALETFSYKKNFNWVYVYTFVDSLLNESNNYLLPWFFQQHCLNILVLKYTLFFYDFN